MKKRFNILAGVLLLSLIAIQSNAQDNKSAGGYLVPVCIYKGDTIPSITLPDVYIFKPLKFRNDKERKEYYRLVYNVKKPFLFHKKLTEPL